MNIVLVDKIVVLGLMYFRELITNSWENTGIRNSKKFKVIQNSKLCWPRLYGGKVSRERARTKCQKR